MVALPRYWTFIALGIQRCEDGVVASINMPMATSARLHAAIAWKVLMWL
ncbi:Uncharacterised protein [Mycobacteroides abscessus subsp. abscessus]|nr:Uncharacterised protein [Mycobacteroides abscessus subsp. abscessus]